MPGVDGITSEMLKTSVRDCMTVWIELLTQIWSDQKAPSDWTKGTIIKLFKKGDALVCGNWRGINIISIPSKLMSIIILQRLQQKLEQHLRDEKHGFQPGRSWANLIFTLRMLVEDSKEWNKKLYLLFIDLDKAFDSVDREILWKIIKHYGIPPKVVELIIVENNNKTKQHSVPGGLQKFK